MCIVFKQPHTRVAPAPGDEMRAGDRALSPVEQHCRRWDSFIPRNQEGEATLRKGRDRAWAEKIVLALLCCQDVERALAKFSPRFSLRTPKVERKGSLPPKKKRRRKNRHSLHGSGEG